MAGKPRGRPAKSKVKATPKAKAPAKASPKADAPKAPKASPVKAMFDMMVQFKNVNVGDGTARMGIVIDRQLIKLEQADSLFCERRLDVRVVLGAKKDAPGQQLLATMEDADFAIEGSCDTRKYSVGSKTFATGLTFNLKEIPVEVLTKFATKSGRFIIFNAGVIPDVVDESTDLKGGLKQTKIRSEISLDEVFSGKHLKAMKSKGLETVGDLDIWLRSHMLTTLPAIGESEAAKIADKLATIPWPEPDGDKDEDDEDGEDEDE